MMANGKEENCIWNSGLQKTTISLKEPQGVKLISP